MSRKIVWLFAVVLILLMAACAPANAPAAATPPVSQATPVPTVSTSSTATPKAQPKESWQGKWDALVEASKAEGKVVIYTTSGSESRIAFQKAFKDNFGINTEWVGGSASAVGAKAMAERRAGLRLADLLTGAGTQDVSSLKPAGFTVPIEVGTVLILPDFSDPKLWLGGEVFWQEPEHTSLAYSRYEIQIVARNTDLVKDGEIQSYKDLLNPKWKGKIIVADPSLGGVALKALVMIGRYTMGWDYVRSLVKQEPLLVNDFRLQAEWLARGKYAIGYGVKTDELYAFKKLGLPVEITNMREGGYLASGSGMVSLMKDAPHANSAKLFINWLLSREGQTIFSNVGGYPSARLDVSDKDAMYPRVAPDSKAPAGDVEEAILTQNEDTKLIREILQPLLK